MTQCACTYANVVDKRFVGARCIIEKLLLLFQTYRALKLSRVALLAFCHMLVGAAALTNNQSSSAHPDDRRLGCNTLL
jgi:hypothetical protein